METKRKQRVVRGRESEPRLPHDRDESVDSQATPQPPADDIGERAFDDAVSGRADTDRGAVTDALYRRTLRDAGTVAAAPAPRRGRSNERKLGVGRKLPSR